MLALWLLACSPDPLPSRSGAGGDIPPANAPTPRDDHETSPYTPSTPTGAASDCGDGLVCVDAFPFVHAGDTRQGVATFDQYACDPGIDEGGREIVYQVTVAASGFLSATLSGVDAGVDIDVQVLGSLDADDCLDRGHWEGATWVEPGTYYVVADSWVASDGTALEGEYTLAFHLVEPSDEVEGRALWAFDQAWKEGEATRLRLAIADFDRPSDERRFHLFDLATGEVMFEEYVSHGEGSSDPNDPAIVAEMSNVDGSHMSSVGVMRASESYDGSHGLSMRLDGLEPGFNDAVRDRAIVVHNADYATEDFVDDYGYLGQSWGCAVIDPVVSADVIDALNDGGILVSHFSDPDWLSDSDYLRGY